MKARSEIKKIAGFHGEEGGTKAFALVALTLVFLAGYAGWNYLPAIYQVESFKAEMPNTIMQVMALPHGTDEPLANKVKMRLRTLGNDNGVPANALIEVTESGRSIKAHVKFTREVNILPFGIYKYQYQFDNTAAQ
jgi:hypothetical protein